MNFEFHVRGLEDAIVETLSTSGNFGRSEIDLYQGELSSAEDVRKALGNQARRFPLILVAYGSTGKPELSPATGTAYGSPRTYSMPCSITILALDRVTRGTEERSTRGVYALLSDAMEAITDRHFYATRGGVPVLNETSIESQLDELVLLNKQPMVIEGIDYLARIPNAVAYALIFSTAFDFTSTDRRRTRTISAINFGIDTKRVGQLSDTAPGVHPEG